MIKQITSMFMNLSDSHYTEPTQASVPVIAVDMSVNSDINAFFVSQFNHLIIQSLHDKWTQKMTCICTPSKPFICCKYMVSIPPNPYSQTMRRTSEIKSTNQNI